MAKQLLLISAVPEDQAFALAAAEQAGLELRIEPEISNVASLMEGDAPPIVFINGEDVLLFKAFEKIIENKFGLFSDHVNANCIHVISGKDLNESQEVLSSPLFGNFILRKYGDPGISGERYGLILQSTITDKAFGTEKLFSKDAKIQTVHFQSTAQKQQGVEAVKNFLIQAKFKTRMATVIANAVDELIMNAMFDAPVDEFGKQIYQSTPRDKVFDLKDKAAVEMRVVYDKGYIGITAVDQWGSLDKERLLNHISRRYREEEYKVKTTSAGAGIGLATIFRSGGSFLFASESGTRTEVTTFFKKADNFRNFKEQFRFISTQFYF